MLVSYQLMMKFWLSGMINWQMERLHWYKMSLFKVCICIQILKRVENYMIQQKAYHKDQRNQT